jgi:hypothetical protein
VSDAGHVFGRLGEGNGNYPGVSAPFYWGAVVNTNTPSILVSLFPDSDSDAGLNSATEKIIIEGKAYTWTTMESFNAPI